MKYSWIIFAVGIVLRPCTLMAVDFPATTSGSGDKSFLIPQTFPTTFNDLSFVEQMNVLRSGYEPWESEYDDYGSCLTNCAYPGITIEDDLKALQNNTDAARAVLAGYQSGTVTNFPTPIDITSSETVKFPVVNTAAPSQISRCASVNSAIPANQMVPLGLPLVGRVGITSPYGDRIHPVTKKRQVHKGVDFSAPIGTSVYAAANGTVESIWTDQTCGRGLRIKHSDGFSSLYCHLSGYDVALGDPVNAGCMVAKTGNTGRSTGPHLHYGLYYNNKLINPTEYINR